MNRETGEPETLEEVRYEAMGIILGMIDTMRTMAPPPHMSGREALCRFADLAERSVREAYGEEKYDHFKATTRGVGRIN